MNINPTQKSDFSGIRSILADTELFPPDLLPELFSSSDRGESVWFTASNVGGVIGFCYAVPEMLADRVWNMQAIGVLAPEQRRGVGVQLTQALESHLKCEGQRLLFVDTSSLPEFAQARAFYLKHGYDHVSTLPDYWEPGDDKVTFLKRLV